MQSCGGGDLFATLQTHHAQMHYYKTDYTVAISTANVQMAPFFSSINWIRTLQLENAILH